MPMTTGPKILPPAANTENINMNFCILWAVVFLGLCSASPAQAHSPL